MRSPCLDCDHLPKSKNTRRCADCRRRLDYVAGLECWPGCTQDPCYAAAYSLPRFARGWAAASPWSEAEIIPS